MPVAGRLASDRANAHYRWAQRYAAREAPCKAASHLGRAMHYGALPVHEHIQETHEHVAKAALALRITENSTPMALWFSRVDGSGSQSVDVHLNFKEQHQEKRVSCNPRGAAYTMLDIGKALEAMAGSLGVNAGKRMQLIRLVSNACAALASSVAARLSTCDEALRAKGNKEGRFSATG